MNSLIEQQRSVRGQQDAGRRLGLVLAVFCIAVSAVGGTYRHFEARHTHPVTLTAGGQTLLALNSPAARLSVFDVSGAAASQPVLLDEIPVGLEPVSVRPRTADEVWVVCELSDCVSVVSLARRQVIATLPCPDEPADVVFAGGKAFVSCARSSQLRVFDAATRTELGVVPLLGNLPRALATDAAGERVLVAFQFSGNRTTVLPATVAPEPPAPLATNLPPAPRTALIVPADDPRVPYRVLDHDVAVVSVAEQRVLGYRSDAGTCLFDLAARPGTDEVWVANTEARNLIRFEPNLKGHFADNRVTRLNLATESVTPFDLNPGLDYTVLPNPAAQATALAQPMALTFTGDGTALWVAAFASDRLAQVDAHTGAVLARVDLRPSGGARAMRGPRGLALNEAAGRLFVLNKLANTVSVIATGDGRLLSEVPAGSHDPLPPLAKAGRGFLFDARLSGNGTASCATCHNDADRDGLAWDLGDPAGSLVTVIGADLSVHDPEPQVRVMHPMKGPMTTQTLRGLSPTNLLHWRGDKPTLADFNPTFRDLMGGELQSAEDMSALAEYVFSVRHHPNPNRPLDNRLPATFNGGNPTRGLQLYSVHINHCAVCHVLPTGSDNNVDDRRNFGGLQSLKTPGLGTVYQRALLDTRAGATNVTGFGLLHDGTGGRQSLPTVHFYELDLLSGTGFTDVSAFVQCFDTGTAPAVGFFRTATAADATNATLLADLAAVCEQASRSNACDVVAREFVGGETRTFLFAAGAAAFQESGIPHGHSAAQLLGALPAGARIEFLATLPGNGERFAHDRDGDGIADPAVSAPRLNATLSPTGVTLDWADEAGWVLEASGGDGGFSPVTGNPPLRHNRRLELTAPADGSAVRLFRLRRTW
jgi:DNA-binding beta-propeller fold protein YncE